MSAVRKEEWIGYTGDDFMKNFVFLETSYGMMDGHPMNLNTPTHKFREILDMYNARGETENEKLPIIRLSTQTTFKIYTLGKCQGNCFFRNQCQQFYMEGQV